MGYSETPHPQGLSTTHAADDDVSRVNVSQSSPKPVFHRVKYPHIKEREVEERRRKFGLRGMKQRSWQELGRKQRKQQQIRLVLRQRQQQRVVGGWH